MINRLEPYKVVFEDHQSDVSEVIGRFSCPHTAKRVASEFNALLSQRMPVTTSPFPFYYVHTELASGTLPWIANLIIHVENEAESLEKCNVCKVRTAQYGRRGMCQRCQREEKKIKKGVCGGS